MFWGACLDHMTFRRYQNTILYVTPKRYDKHPLHCHIHFPGSQSALDSIVEDRGYLPITIIRMGIGPTIISGRIKTEYQSGRGDSNRKEENYS